MWYPDNQLRKTLNLYMVLQAKKTNEQLDISAQTTEIKLLKFQQLMIYELPTELLSCQFQFVKLKPYVKTFFLEKSLI